MEDVASLTLASLQRVELSLLQLNERVASLEQRQIESSQTLKVFTSAQPGGAVVEAVRSNLAPSVATINTVGEAEARTLEPQVCITKGCGARHKMSVRSSMLV